MLNQQEERAIFKEVKGQDSFEEEAPLLVGKTFSSSSSAEQNQARQEHGSSTQLSTVGESSWSVAIRHSRLYVALSLFQLLTITSMIIWVALDKNAIHNPFFVFLELVVTISIIFDTVLQIHYQGPRKFFCDVELEIVESSVRMEDEEPNEYMQLQMSKNQESENQRRETEAKLKRKLEKEMAMEKKRKQQKWMRRLGLVMNYLQLALAVFCVVAFVSTVTATSPNWEEDVSLSLLLIRYAALLCFFAVNQYRALAIQGGILKACGSGEQVDDNWDVKF